MSENAIKPRWLIALALEVPRGVYREIEDRLREEVAAAEERGRRLGVEERDELRALLIASRPFVADHFQKHALGINAKYHLDLLHRIDAALAPRDSAPVTENDVAASCFGVAPRDSGKVEP